MKTALIVGCEGQDGPIAFDLLLNKGYQVLGLGRNTIRRAGVAWEKSVDITRQDAVLDLMNSQRFDEIYYLAACHHSSQDKPPDEIALWKESQAVNVDGLLYFLKGIADHAPQTRLFYAASSLIYGNPSVEIQDENTPFAPDTIYGMSKLNGLLLCRYYRQHHGVFASTGILYNHESQYRRETFISQKIIQAAIRISRGKQESLVVGDLNAVVDWGYAPDYVEAMHLILNAPIPDEFVIASGIKHSVRDFVQITFDFLGLDWQKYVHENPEVTIRKRKTLIGNSEKLIKATGWSQRVDFKGMIKLLLQAQEMSL